MINHENGHSRPSYLAIKDEKILWFIPLSTKTEKYKNASGEVMWSISVTGTFSYNGSSCTCTKATVSTTKPSSMWSLSNKKASKSGNKAIASVTGHAPGVTVTRTVTLTCSPSGNLS